MRMTTLHIDGDMEDLGVFVGEELDTYLHAHVDKVNNVPFQFSDTLTQFFNGVSDVADLRKEVVGSIILEAEQEGTGTVVLYGDHLLTVRYQFQRDDELLLCVGDIKGQDVFLMSQSPHPPGSLLGLCRSGIAWARPVPKSMRSDDYEVLQIPEIPLRDWMARISLLRLSSNFTFALPFDHRMVKKQGSYRHKPLPTPEAAARKSFEDAQSAVDLLVMLDTEALEVTLIRGTGQEKTYDLTADF